MPGLVADLLPEAANVAIFGVALSIIGHDSHIIFHPSLAALQEEVASAVRCPGRSRLDFIRMAVTAFAFLSAEKRPPVLPICFVLSGLALRQRQI